jgi:hypothetical protein
MAPEQLRSVVETPADITCRPGTPKKMQSGSNTMQMVATWPQEAPGRRLEIG